MGEPKKYGLIIPKGNKAAAKKSFQPKASIFGDESDDEDAHVAVNKTLNKEAKKTLMKKQTQIDIEKALSEDPNIFDYDGVYDKMVEEKKEKDVRLLSKKDSRPKYITNLLKAAEVRKKEEERRNERKVQKEREAEKDQFADKESFVTSAYKKKMAEMQAAEEKERREAALEAALDVTKQRDMSGFYRHIYRQTMGEETEKPEIKEEKDDVKVKEEADSSSSSSSSSSGDSDSDGEDAPKQKGSAKTRDRSSESESEATKQKRIDDRDRYKDDSKVDRHRRDDDRYRRDTDRHRRDDYRDRKGDRHSDDRDRKKDRYSDDRDRKKDRYSDDRDRKKDRYSDDRDRKKDRYSDDRDRKKDRLDEDSDRHKKGDKNRKEDERYQRESKKDERHRTDDSAKKDTLRKTDKDTKEKGETESKKRGGDDVSDQLLSKISKKNVGEKVDDAKMRYLMRRQGKKAPVVTEDD